MGFDWPSLNGLMGLIIINTKHCVPFHHHLPSLRFGLHDRLKVSLIHRFHVHSFIAKLLLLHFIMKGERE